MTRIPAAWNTASSASVKLASRSCRTNFARAPASPRSMSRFRACWTTQDWTGCSVAPRTRTRRLPCPITASTYTFRAIEQVSGEEVQRQDPLRLRPQELRPPRAVPARRRVDPGVLEDLPHRRRRHRDAEPGKLTVDPPAPP